MSTAHLAAVGLVSRNLLGRSQLAGLDSLIGVLNSLQSSDV